MGLHTLIEDEESEKQCAWVKAAHAAPPPTPADPAAALLDEAKRIVTGARRSAYGNPEDNFATIAALWTAYWERRTSTGEDWLKFSPGDVAVMMVLMKCARLAETPDHHDSTLDIAGYAACLARCQQKAVP